MKIKDIRASVHRLPIYLPRFEKPTEHRHHVFCEVETDEGHVGFGLTARFLTRAVASALTDDILPAVRDMDPRDLEAVHERVGRVVSERGIMTGANLAAAPINMNIGEVYLALQQGTVDGQENPLGNIRKWSWYEVQKYISISRHVYTPITFVMNLARYEGLSDDQRAAVGRAARAAVLASREYGTQNDANLLVEITELAKGKVAFNDIDVEAFQAAAGPIAVEIGKVAGEEFTASVMAAIQ